MVNMQQFIHEYCMITVHHIYTSIIYLVKYYSCTGKSSDMKRKLRDLERGASVEVCNYNLCLFKYGYMNNRKQAKDHTHLS